MAVVFISPRRQQRVFFLGITVIFLLFLAAISVGVFLSKPKDVSISVVFNKPKVNIDMQIFNTEQFKGLRPFAQMEIQFSYKAATKDNELKTGFITAVSIEQARKFLEDSGLTISELEETEIGRDNPFTPYYQQIVLPTPTLAPTRR